MQFLCPCFYNSGWTATTGALGRGAAAVGGAISAVGGAVYSILPPREVVFMAGGVILAGVIAEAQETQRREREERAEAARIEAARAASWFPWR